MSCLGDGRAPPPATHPPSRLVRPVISGGGSGPESADGRAGRDDTFRLRFAGYDLSLDLSGGGEGS